MKADRRLDLMEQLVLQEMGCQLQSLPPVSMSIDETMAYIWPFNERLRPHFEQIRSLPYVKRFERQADDAVARGVLEGAGWDDLPAPVWRVLLERQFQCLQLLALRAAEVGSWNAGFMPIPEGAPESVRQGLAVLFLLFDTPLPFPIVERSGADLPQGAAPGPLTRQ